MANYRVPNHSSSLHLARPPRSFAIALARAILSTARPLFGTASTTALSWVPIAIHRPAPTAGPIFNRVLPAVAAQPIRRRHNSTIYIRSSIAICILSIHHHHWPGTSKQAHNISPKNSFAYTLFYLPHFFAISVVRHYHRYPLSTRRCHSPPPIFHQSRIYLPYSNHCQRRHIRINHRQNWCAT